MRACDKVLQCSNTNIHKKKAKIINDTPLTDPFFMVIVFSLITLLSYFLFSIFHFSLNNNDQGLGSFFKLIFSFYDITRMKIVSRDRFCVKVNCVQRNKKNLYIMPNSESYLNPLILIITLN